MIFVGAFLGALIFQWDTFNSSVYEFPSLFEVVLVLIRRTGMSSRKKCAVEGKECSPLFFVLSRVF